MGERREQQPRGSWFHKKEPKIPPVTGTDVAKRVLYGTWDATKKIAERHSPRGWNEWIIGKMNNVIPKLTPEWQAWVAQHHQAIETGATVGGVVLSSAELYTVFLLANLANLKRYQLKYQRGLSKQWKSAWFASVAEDMKKTGPLEVKDLAALGGTLFWLIQNTFDKRDALQRKYPNQPEANIPIWQIPKPKRAERVIFAQFMAAHKSRYQYERQLYRRPTMADVDVEQEARDLYALWKQGGLPGVGGILDAANVRNPKVRVAFLKTQGILHHDYAQVDRPYIRPPTIAKDRFGRIVVVREINENKPPNKLVDLRWMSSVQTKRMPQTPRRRNNMRPNF